MNMIYNVLCISLTLSTLIVTVDLRPQPVKPPYSTSKLQLEEGTKPEQTNTSQSRTKTRILTNVRNPNRVLGENIFASLLDILEQDIVFPDSFEVVFQPLPRIDGPPKCADGLTFCENFDSYPYNHLRDVLNRNKEFNDLFGVDEVPKEITNRIGDDEDTFVCKSIQKTIFPKVGKNKNSKWKYIINQGESDGFVQGVQVETCYSLGSECDVIGDLPNGYKTSCKQKYVYRRMLSLNDNGRPIPDTFQLPSACCCAYKRNVEFLARFGAPVTPATAKI